MKYQSALMNPPYSADWSADKEFLQDDRFKKYGKLAPKSKADFAFLLHGFYQLDDNGTMAVVLPHGVLFRGSAEAVIRKTLLENGNIDAVIGLPGNLFVGTTIPTVIIVLKKNRQNNDVFFIDASKDFIKGKKQNTLSEEHLKKILSTYKNRQDVDKYAHIATLDEIKENDYNLNIPRYVDTFEEEEPIDLVAVNKEIMQIDKEIEASEAELISMLGELAITDDTKEIIESTIAMFRKEW